MTHEELVARYGGYVLNNKARVVVDGRNVVVARILNGEWALTAEGAELANVIDVTPVEVPAAPAPRRTRQAPVGLVNSGQVGSDPATE